MKMTIECDSGADLLAMARSLCDGEIEELHAKVTELRNRVLAAETKQAHSARPQEVEALIVEVRKGTNKIAQIKLVREICGIGLKDAKDLVEKSWGQLA